MTGKVIIKETTYQLDGDNTGKMAIFVYVGSGDPTEALDKAVRLYVGTHGYHEYIDSSLVNPWVRVVIEDVNQLPEQDFDNQRLVSSSQHRE